MAMKIKVLLVDDEKEPATEGQICGYQKYQPDDEWIEIDGRICDGIPGALEKVFSKREGIDNGNLGYVGKKMVKSVHNVYECDYPEGCPEEFVFQQIFQPPRDHHRNLDNWETQTLFLCPGLTKKYIDA